jgi:hypothetical protein
MSDTLLNLEERLRRKMGRPARTQSVATRFTKGEELELQKAAEREGKTLREWTREALLREARRPEDDPVFTEIIAIRVFLNSAIRALNLGETWTQEQFDALTATVKKEKRQAARELMAQYIHPNKL